MNFPSIQNGFGQQNHIGIMNPQVQPQQVPIQFVPSIQNGFGQQNHIRIENPLVQPQQVPNQFVPSIQNGFGQQNDIRITNPQVQPQQVLNQFGPSIHNGFGQQNHIRMASPQVQPQQVPNQFGSLPTPMQVDAAIWLQLGNLTAQTNHLMKGMKETQTTKDNVVQILVDLKEQMIRQQQSKKRKRRNERFGSRRKIGDGSNGPPQQSDLIAGVSADAIDSLKDSICQWANLNDKQLSTGRTDGNKGNVMEQVVNPAVKRMQGV